MCDCDWRYRISEDPQFQHIHYRKSIRTIGDVVEGALGHLHPVAVDQPECVTQAFRRHHPKLPSEWNNFLLCSRNNPQDVPVLMYAT